MKTDEKLKEIRKANLILDEVVVVLRKYEASGLIVLAVIGALTMDVMEDATEKQRANIIKATIKQTTGKTIHYWANFIEKTR